MASKRTHPLLFGGVSNTYENRDSEFLCPVCLSIMSEPYVTVCGHSFCHSCIVKSLDMSNKCPKCSMLLEGSRGVFPNVTLDAIIRRKTRTAEYLHSSPKRTLLGEFTALVEKDLHPAELDYMLDVLQQKKSEVETEYKLLENQLLREFIQELERRKVSELQQLQTKVSCLQNDLKQVDLSLEAVTKMTVPVGKEEKEDDDKSLSSPVVPFNATFRKSPMGLTQRRTRMHTHFDDLEKYYWSLRDPVTGVCESSGLEQFRTSLSRMTMYGSMKSLANLSYGTDLLNTANIVSSIEFDKDADFFAIAGVTKRIKIFDYSTVVSDVVDMHYPVMDMVANSKISCVSWSSYHKSVLCSSDYEGTVSLWDSSVGTRMRVFQEHKNRCWSVDFNRMDSQLIASGSDDSRIKLWSLNCEHSVATLEAKANVCCVKFNPSSRYHLAYGAADHCVHYVDLRQPKEPLQVFKGHRKAVSYVKFLDENTLVSASTDSQLKLWSTQDNSCIRSFKGHTNEKNFVGLTNNDDFIACGSENNAFYVYYKGLSQPLMHYKFDVVKSVLDKERTEEDSAEFISAVCWKPKSNVIVAANSQGTIKILELI